MNKITTEQDLLKQTQSTKFKKLLQDISKQCRGFTLSQNSKTWVIVGATATKKNCAAKYKAGKLTEEFINDFPYIPRQSYVALIKSCEHINKCGHFPYLINELQNK